jgi:hypothetical protein
MNWSLLIFSTESVVFYYMVCWRVHPLPHVFFSLLFLSLFFSGQEKLFRVFLEI